MRIQAKIVAGQFLIILGIIATAIYADTYVQQFRLCSRGDYSVTAAQVHLQNIYQRLFDRIDALHIYGQNPALQRHLKKSNLEFKVQPDWAQNVSLINGVIAKPSPVTANEISRHLRNRFIDVYTRRHGKPYMEQLLVSNFHGEIIAQTHMTPGYNLRKNRSWWNKVKENGYDIAFHLPIAPREAMKLEVAVRIDDHQGRFAGVIAGMIPLTSIVRAEQFFSGQYAATEVHLFTGDGNYLFGATRSESDAETARPSVSDSLPFNKAQGYFFTGHNGNQTLVSYVTSTDGTAHYSTPNWYMVSIQDVRSFLPQHDLPHQQILWISLAAILVVLLVSLFISTSITIPIKKMHNAARKVVQGQTNKKICYPAKDELGELAHSFNAMMTGLLNSRTELQRVNNKSQAIENELMERTRQLEQSNSDFRQFAHFSAHHLQEPLRKVNNYMSLVEERYQNRLDEDAKAYIQYAIDGALRMKTLIDDLLRLSRVQTQKQTVTSTDVAGVIATVMADLASLIAKHHAVIRCDELPQIHADVSQINHLFRNLMANAIKYRGPHPPKIHISAHREEDSWLFSVKDNGIGIDPRFSERIFQVFQRLHPKGVYPGNGVGLAICKKIVERHGGKIWVQSIPGDGSTFIFTIPDSIKNDSKK